jgi:branched-chain amino acid transport system ATP-binding protein
MSHAETDSMIALVASLPKELGVLMIEHDMNVVFSLAHTITVLYYGEVLASGPPAAIRENDAVRKVYLGMAH